MEPAKYASILQIILTQIVAKNIVCTLTSPDTCRSCIASCYCLLLFSIPFAVDGGTFIGIGMDILGGDFAVDLADKDTTKVICNLVW